MIRCGDTVKHGPTGETWLVAYADYERDELSWYGWPEGRAALSDCELVTPCSDEDHQKAVREWIDRDRDDHRVRAVRRLYT